MRKKLFLFIFTFSLLTLHAVPFQNAVAAYDMTVQNGSIQDITGHGYNSSGLGGATQTTSTYGKALYFDGSDQVVINDASGLRLLAPFSVEAKFMMTGTPGDWVRVVGKGSSSQRNYGLWYNPVYNYFLFQIYDTPRGVYGDAIITKGISMNQWYHIAGVYDGSTMKLYVNGNLEQSIAFSATPGITSDNLTLGYAGYHTTHIGLIDDVALFNTALSGSDVLAHSQTNMETVVPEPISLFSLLLGIFILGISSLKQQKNLL
ncbi:MAG: LamG domain-containing protein [Candidatus Brocadiae bacterium]|nr:LamG domain-containing protein [Candidatus Brocadiia bacterium]